MAMLLNQRHVIDVLPWSRTIGRVGVLAFNGYNTTLLLSVVLDSSKRTSLMVDYTKLACVDCR